MQEDQFIDQLHVKLLSIDRSINDWANNNIQPFMFDGKITCPEDAAREVRDAVGQFEWLDDDISIGQSHVLKIDNTDVIRLRDARRVLNQDLCYLNIKLPEIDIFPEIAELLNMQQDLFLHNKISEILKNDDFPSLINNDETTLSQVEKLLEMLDAFGKNKKTIDSSKSFELL